MIMDAGKLRSELDSNMEQIEQVRREIGELRGAIEPTLDEIKRLEGQQASLWKIREGLHGLQNTQPEIQLVRD